MLLNFIQINKNTGSKIFGFNFYILILRFNCNIFDGMSTKIRSVYSLVNHLPSITKTIQVRRTRHAGHSWRSRDELISDVLLWTPTYGRAKAGRPARTYIQQLCEDTGCNPEDLPEAMNDKEKWLLLSSSTSLVLD